LDAIITLLDFVRF